MADLQEPRPVPSRRSGRRAAPAAPSATPPGDFPAGAHEPLPGHRRAEGHRAPAITAPNGMPVLDALRDRRQRTGEMYLQRDDATPAAADHRPLNTYLPEFSQTPETPSRAPEAEPQQFRSRAERRRAEGRRAAQVHQASPVGRGPEGMAGAGGRVGAPEPGGPRQARGDAGADGRVGGPGRTAARPPAETPANAEERPWWEGRAAGSPHDRPGSAAPSGGSGSGAAAPTAGAGGEPGLDALSGGRTRPGGEVARRPLMPFGPGDVESGKQPAPGPRTSAPKRPGFDPARLAAAGTPTPDAGFAAAAGLRRRPQDAAPALGGANPGGRAPGGTNPGGAVAGGAALDDVDLRGTVPGEAVPGEAGPGGVAVGGANRRGLVPGKAVPGGAAGGALARQEGGPVVRPSGGREAGEPDGARDRLPERDFRGGAAGYRVEASVRSPHRGTAVPSVSEIASRMPAPDFGVSARRPEPETDHEIDDRAHAHDATPDFDARDGNVANGHDAETKRDPGREPRFGRASREQGREQGRGAAPVARRHPVPTTPPGFQSVQHAGAGLGDPQAFWTQDLPVPGRGPSRPGNRDGAGRLGGNEGQDRYGRQDRPARQGAYGDQDEDDQDGYQDAYREEDGQDGYRDEGDQDGYRDEDDQDGYRDEGDQDGYRDEGDQDGYRDEGDQDGYRDEGDQDAYRARDAYQDGYQGHDGYREHDDRHHHAAGPFDEGDLRLKSPRQLTAEAFNRQQREERAREQRARDDSDAMWLTQLSRPVTPENLFRPHQPPADQNRYAPAQYAPDRTPDRALDRAHDRAPDRTPGRQHPGDHPDPRHPGNQWQRAQARPPRPSSAPHQAPDGHGHPSNPPARPRLAWIDTARGLAISLVVFIHASQWMQESTISTPLWNDINEIVSTLRMPLFFMCAGLLATKWLYQSWADLLSKKVFFLGWVYLLWQVVGSFQAVVASTVTGDDLSPMRMALSLALTPARPRFELWFIWALAIFFVVARLCSRFPLAPQLAIGALLGGVAFSHLVPEVNLGWNGVPKYYLFFLIGCYYRPLLLALAARVTRQLAIGAIVGWLVLASVAYFTGVLYLPLVGVVVRILGLVTGIGLAVLLQDVKLFAYLGSRTLPIYLAHTPILVVMVAVLDPVASSGAVQAVKWILPFVLTVPAIWLALKVNEGLMKTPARMLYEPPQNLTDLVRDTVGGRPRGAQPMPKDMVPGLTRQPFDRQLENVLM